MQTIAFADLDPSATIQVPFNGQSVSITTAPEGFQIEAKSKIKDLEHFHGPTVVDHVVNFGPSLSSLIGTYEDTEGYFSTNHDDMTVLTNSDTEAGEEAREVVEAVNQLAIQLIGNNELYSDEKFCRRYYDLALKGYGLLSRSDNISGHHEPKIPVSLIRAGLVTTRLAHGAGMNAVVKDEIQVETKRAQPIDGNPEDIMVTVRWTNPEDPQKLNGQSLEIADFVNPASWASTAALLLALKHGHNVVPKSIEHRSFMGTMQGVMMAIKECKSMGILPSFILLGITDTMDKNYYLSGKISVGDAGNALKHFRPKL
ncbi:hypothetical protein KBB49_04230 [Candidatus Saccharibacteria bacterium]|nr:hypothetical protein [Candidatus Saccharibacteria bacterium]